MYSSMKALVVILVMLLTLSGCGDLLGKKVVKRELDSSQFEVQCELNLDEFSNILNRNISSQIRCLGENLNFFIRIVKSGKPGYLSRVQLQKYLEDFRPDVKPEMITALKAVFDLGHLITGDDPDYISKDTVDKVIEFALVFNREVALHHGQLFQNDGPASYELHRNHRERISNANLTIIESFRKVFNYNRPSIHALNIVDLLKSFSTDSTAADINKVIQVLFVKKLIIGGEEKVITNLELERLINNFDRLVLIVFDVVRYKYINLNQEYIFQMLNTDVANLESIINYGNIDRREETLFKVDQLLNGLKLYIPKEDLDIEKFEDVIYKVKTIAMKGERNTVKGKDLDNLFSHAKTLLNRGILFHRIYKHLEEQMNDPRPVSETIDFNEYENTYSQNIEEVRKFKRIATDYRFMRGSERSIFYVNGSKRDAEGMVEIALFEYIIKVVLSEYGKPTTYKRPGDYPKPGEDPRSEFSITQFPFRELVKDFKKALEEMDLISKRKAFSTADNISLLGTLFQYQSDDNEMMDTNEATEFFVSLFASINIADDMHNYMVAQGCARDKFDRIESDCFKQKFWKSLCAVHKRDKKEYSYRDNFPFMFKYLKAPENCEDIPEDVEGTLTKQFLDTAILASRSCHYFDQGTPAKPNPNPKEAIPYSEGDMMTIMLAIMHTETTILRWDTNFNNFMDADEVDKAYSVYKGALSGFLVSQPVIIQKLHKQIYQYMIKYEKVPDAANFKSVWHFVKFLISFKWKSSAQRKTMVGILNVIGEQTRIQNEKDPAVPKFLCEWLRDPENGIPDEDEMPLVKQAVLKDVKLTATTNKILGLSPALQEKLKAELEQFVDDMLVNEVEDINDIKQSNLRKLFKEISKNPDQMKEINIALSEGTDVQKIGLAVSTIFHEEFKMGEASSAR